MDKMESSPHTFLLYPGVVYYGDPQSFSNPHNGYPQNGGRKAFDYGFETQ